MQDCFREHPDVYGDELELDDEEGGEAPEHAGEQQAAKKPQLEEKSPAAQAGDQKPVEEQSEEVLPPGRGLYEGKAVLQEREEAKESPVEAKAAKIASVEAEPKANVAVSPQSATRPDPPSSNAQSGQSTK
jgi:hypothetical protein